MNSKSDDVIKDLRTPDEPFRRIGWDNFAASGLLSYTNVILSAFGIMLIDISPDNDGSIIEPVRTGFRGIDKDMTDQMYSRISFYLHQMGSTLHKESTEMDIFYRMNNIMDNKKVKDPVIDMSDDEG